MTKFLLIVIFIISYSAFSKVDPFNTYRFNRKNALRNNNIVDTSPWYEWWYYKVTIPETNESFYFCYGVVNPWDKDYTLLGTRSTLSIGDFKNKTIIEKKFPIESFKASYLETKVNINQFIATDKQITGALSNDQGKYYNWNIFINKKWAYNATGWATGQGITNIEWYPAQADATCSGEIISDDRTIKFQNAPCYQDRNWGKSFPKWWTWIVSNNFENNPNSAIAIGGGWPKILGSYTRVKGVSIGLKHKNKQYSWRPNYFSKIITEVKFGKWEIIGINKKHKIVISAFAPREEFLDLEFMTPEGEIFHDYETLNGKMSVMLYKKKTIFPLQAKWILIDTLKTNYAGIEFGSRDTYSFENMFTNHFSLD